MRKFVHPGVVTSKNDGDEHYIGFHDLCRLYKLDPRECIDASRPDRMLGFSDAAKESGQHFFPKYHGDYPQ